MSQAKKNYSEIFFKSSLAIIFCFLVRLIPLRAPNVEPIFATMMPMSKAYGALVGFSFVVLSILLYDTLTSTLGVQTFFTVGAYGVISLWSAKYFKNFKNKVANRWSFVRFAIMGTLVFDALTGLTVGPIFFHQSFLASVIGQIPFTALHLVGNVAFAFILSPVIYNFLIKKKTCLPAGRETKPAPIISILNPKTI